METNYAKLLVKIKKNMSFCQKEILKLVDNMAVVEVSRYKVMYISTLSVANNNEGINGSHLEIY